MLEGGKIKYRTEVVVSNVLSKCLCVCVCVREWGCDVGGRLEGELGYIVMVMVMVAEPANAFSQVVVV